MIYSLNEKVVYFNDIKPFGDKSAYSSSNAFESLGTTNPELFNLHKLEQLEHSKKLVREFNEYFFAIYAKEGERFKEFAKGRPKNWTQKDIDDYQKEFNVSVFTGMYSYAMYLTRLGYSAAMVDKLLFKEYIPGSLSEEGCRELVRIRIENTKRLVDSLCNMMESNYKSLGISVKEASTLTSQLKDRKKNDEAIGAIKALMNKPEFLDKFKIDDFSYDFRPIGGACVFIANGVDLAASHPSKYIPNLFKYDCIVYGHGSYLRRERPYTPLAIWFRSMDRVFDRVTTYIDELLNLDKKNPGIFTPKSKTELVEISEWVYDQKFNKNLSQKDIHKLREKIKRAFDIILEAAPKVKKEEHMKMMYAYADAIDNAYQLIVVKDDLEQAKIDGKSAAWIIQPVSTLKHKNVSHVVDLVRVLKKEGFKNICLQSCNPHGVKLPKDIEEDRDITVTMGLHSVLKENGIDLEVVNESLAKDFVSWVKDVVRSISNFAKKAIDRFKTIGKKCSDLIKSKFSDKKAKLDEPVEIMAISITGREASINPVVCNTPEEMEKAVLDSNKAIMEYIETLLEGDKEYISKVEAAIGGRKKKSAFDIEFK